MTRITPNVAVQAPTSDREYHLADGTRVPSVTTIIGRFKESAGLMVWAFNQGKDPKIKKLYEASQESKDIGTLAHSMVEADVHGWPLPERPADVSDQFWARAQSSYAAYVAWKRHSRLEIRKTEIKLVSEQYKYGGRIDAIGQIEDDLCLPDWKTSNSLYWDYLVQIAAYAHLWEENHPDQPLTGGFHLCRFSKEFGDFHHVHLANLDEAWRAFEIMRELYEIVNVLKRRVK